VVVAADHERRTLGQAGVGEAPVHHERPAHLGGEAALELVAYGRQTRPVKDRPQEERAAFGVGGVLIGLDDVRAVLVQELRHRGDYARAVRTRDEEPADVRRAVASCHRVESTCQHLAA